MMLVFGVILLYPLIYYGVGVLCLLSVIIVTNSRYVHLYSYISLLLLQATSPVLLPQCVTVSICSSNVKLLGMYNEMRIGRKSGACSDHEKD